MKQVLFILLFFSFINADYGQAPSVNKNDDERKVYFKAQVEPSFPGGESAWQNFVESNLDTNIPVKNGATTGTYSVTISFIVNIDGSLTNIVCENNAGYGMCQEAIRVIKKSKKWKPATENGRIVNAFHRETIVFRI